LNLIFLGNHTETKIFWNADVTHNRHIIITGKSGAGKTTTLLHLFTELQKSSKYIFFLDYTGSILQYKQISAHDILMHPYIKDTFNQHNLKQDAAINLLLYSDMIANIWKLGVRQKAMITNTLLQMEHLSLKHLNTENRYAEFLTFESGKPLYNVSTLAYCLAEHKTKEYLLLADKFLDYILTTGTHTCVYTPLLEQTSTPRLTTLKFPSVSHTLNAQLTDVFLWSLFFKYKNTENHPPVTIICDEARLLNWSKTGIVTKILNEGRKCKISLILATQSLADEIPKSALPSIFQADLHLAFAPPITDQTIIAKSLFNKPSAENITALSKLPTGYCFARGRLCSDKTPTFQQTVKIKIPLSEEVL